MLSLRLLLLFAGIAALACAEVGDPLNVGTTARAVASLPFYDGFESGTLDTSHWTSASGANGRVRVLGTDGPNAGAYHVILDAAVDGTYALNELTLAIDLSGASNVRLRFGARAFGDEPHPLPTNFTTSANGDGVAISADGVTWYRVVDFSSVLTSTYQNFDVDLDAAIRAASIAYSATFQIKFAQYDNFPTPDDGIGLDEIRVGNNFPDTAPPTGTLAITGELTQTASVALTVTATDTGGSSVADVSFSNDSLTWAPWQTYSSTAAWDITDTRYGGTLSTGVKTVYARFRDTAQNVSTPVSDAIYYGAITPVPFSEDFESGALGVMWTSHSTANGRIRVVSTDGPARGARHAILDSSSGYALNELTLLTNLAGQTGLRLAFLARDWDDEEQALPASFTGSANGDGISISTDGSRWHRVFTLGANLTTTYASFVIDLDAALAASSLSNAGVLFIKFSQYDDYALTTDGIGLDDVMVASSLNDSTPPSGTVSIAGGAASTTNLYAPVTLLAVDPGLSGVTDMRLSNDGTTWENWRAYATTTNWDLSAYGGDTSAGTKTVYAQFRDARANVSASASDAISYQPRSTVCAALTGAGTIGGNASTGGSIVDTDVQHVWDSLGNRFLDHYRLTLPGNGGVTVSVTSAQIVPVVYVYNTSGCTLLGRAVGAAGGAATVAFTASGATYQVVVSTDTAGAIGSYSLSTVFNLVDTTAPTGSITVAAGISTTRFALVTLGLSATDTGGAGVAHMSFSNDGATWSAWETYATSKTSWDLTSAAYGGTSAVGTKTVYARYRDASQNVSSTYSDTITFSPPAPATYPFSDGFESGALGSSWAATSVSPARIRVATSDTPAGGSYHALFDCSADGSYGLNELVLLIDLRGRSGVHLRFFAKSFGDEPEPLPTSFMGSSNGDGVSISADGTTWYRVFDSTTQVTTSYQSFDVDLDTVVQAQGLTYGASFRIKFSQYDNYRITSDGYAYDTVEVGPARDTTAPSGTVSVSGGAATTTTPVVSLSISATDTGGSGLAEMSFSNNGSTWSAWETYAATRSGWDLSASQYGGNSSSGTKRAYARLRDVAGNISATASDDITYQLPDVIAPSGMVTIENGAATTPNALVSLGLSAADAQSGVEDMRLSNDGTQWAPWEPYTSSRFSWDLTEASWGGTSS